jgi:hypothetical protein
LLTSKRAFSLSEFYPHITKIEKRDPALASKRLAALLRGVMIRRTKKCEFDGKPIITLPTKHKEDIDIILSQEERDIYNSSVPTLLSSRSKDCVVSIPRMLICFSRTREISIIAASKKACK